MVVKGQLLCSSARVRLGGRYRCAICAHTYFGEMTEMWEKSTHRHSYVCSWGRAGICVAVPRALGQHQGCGEEQQKALQKHKVSIRCSGWCLALMTQSSPKPQQLPKPYTRLGFHDS